MQVQCGTLAKIIQRHGSTRYHSNPTTKAQLPCKLLGLFSSDLTAFESSASILEELRVAES